MIGVDGLVSYCPISKSWITTGARVLFILCLGTFGFLCLTDTELLARDVSPEQKFKTGVCTDIFQISASSGLRDGQDLLSIAKDVIADAKSIKDRFLRYEYYLYLSELLPSMIENSTDKAQNKTSKLTFKKDMRIHQMKGQLPYLPCKMRIYTADEFQTCVQKRSALNLKTRIVFAGDSRIRQIMETLMHLLLEYDLDIVTLEGMRLSAKQFLGLLGDIHWMKYKQRLNFTSKKLPNFKVEFIWAPIIYRHSKNTFFPVQPNQDDLNKEIEEFNQYNSSNGTSKAPSFDPTKQIINASNMGGALEDFIRLSEEPEENLPSIVVIGSGAWYLYYSSMWPVKLIDQIGIMNVSSLFSPLERLAKRTTIAFTLPDPIKEYITEKKLEYLQKKNFFMEWFMNAQVKLLPKNIQIWDSFLPVAFAAYQDCIRILNNGYKFEDLPAYQSYSSAKSWQCEEMCHTGFESIFIALQMIINQLCNPYMETEEKFCCSR